MEEYIGAIVSLDCGPALGHYQGEVSTINNQDQTLTISKPFRNGVPCTMSELTFSAQDVRKLEIISLTPDPVVVQKSSVPLLPKKARNIGEQMKTQLMPDARSSPKKAFQTPKKSEREVAGGSNVKSRRNQQQSKNDLCFSTPAEKFKNEEFDFEKNLALFDKQAVFEEIDSSQQPDVVRLVDTNRRRGGRTEAKYRHDQNVLHSAPVRYNRIAVPETPEVEYVTDTGLVVPSVTSRARDTLLQAAQRHGLTIGRQQEMLGRGCTEMALQLVGSHARLMPENLHQAPRVACLCGPHSQGAAGLNAARQLAGHGVQVTVFLPDLALTCRALSTELQLYRLTGCRLTHTVSDLPETVDLIVCTLDDHELSSQLAFQPWHRSAVAWANGSRAPVLALDPPAPPPPAAAAPAAIECKYTLGAVLPLGYGAQQGAVYLCNLNVPTEVFRSQRIEYVSPFGPRIVIPLHARDVD
ncbi:enhancer of mRNA-decapping protein 3-like isoform X2 [Amphibalanus amphitrite]|nr:enhancer of mRNA-decapping protein 3-like isoform X2 [Amphibalanus amphitrite]XP_043228697.1 enhancer of mRNA-decapping protein 3-like isoform X2 [Amphibalanus amphitrite]XP_043228698.1 enhancer of mRNA-decapping protein 3-like isoform X2 [Amphibalanus amphitrite]